MRTHSRTHRKSAGSQVTRSESQNEPQMMATTAIVIIVVAALAVAVVWFASAYYGTVYKTDMDMAAETSAQTNNAQAAPAPATSTADGQNAVSPAVPATVNPNTNATQATTR